MITLPDFEKAFDYENNFYLSCDMSRVGKILSHYELYKIAHGVQGAIIECGILKGCSLARFAMFRELFGDTDKKKIIGFDTFGGFPETNFEPDKPLRQRHIEVCGEESISRKQLTEILKRKKVSRNIELVEGDILKTLPEFLKANPDLKISLLNMDVDIYEPSRAILELLFPKIVKGGVILLDDYKVFPGATKAIEDYFKGKKVKIQKCEFSKTPHYIVKK